MDTRQPQVQVRRCTIQGCRTPATEFIQMREGLLYVCASHASQSKHFHPAPMWRNAIRDLMR